MDFKQIAPYIIIALLLVYITSMKKEVVTITIPAKTNTKVISTPQPIAEFKEVIQSNGKLELVKVQNPVNLELLKQYEQAKDSIAKLLVFKDLATDRNYIETLEDSVQTVKVKTKVTGFMRRQEITYKTKAITVTKSVVKSNARIYLGAFSTVPTSTQSPINVGGQISVATNKHLFNVGYTNNGDIVAGVNFKLF